MKSILKVIIPVIFIILLTFILCVIFIKPKVFSFKTTKEYVYIQKNKKDIEEIIIRNDAQLGTSCYKLDIDEGYKILSNINVKSKSKTWCSSSTLYLEFYFKNGTNKKIKFECENLIYSGISYELKDKIMLINKDEYMPDEITNSMIVVTNSERVDCK